MQNNTGLNNDDCKVRSDIKRSLDDSLFIAQITKSTFHIPSCNAQAVVVHSFFNAQVRSIKSRIIFLFIQNLTSPTKNFGTFGPSVPERVSQWVIAACLSELISIA